MGRKNIFEIVANDFEIEAEIARIINLYTTVNIGRSGSIREWINLYFFKNWVHRHTSVNLEDYENRLSINFKQINNIIYNTENYFVFLEYIYNMLSLFKKNYDNENFDINKQNLKQIFYNVDFVLAKLNFEAKEIPEEKYIIVEKNAAATAVAEIVEPEISTAVIEYNHFLLIGDIERKKQILLKLGNKFEPIRSDLKNINVNLEDNIGYILNNFNIRHNNKEKGNYYKEYTAKMTDEDLENWYDEVYQMLLLSFLMIENIDRMKQIDKFKKIIGGKK